MNSTRSASAELGGEALEPRALGAVADDPVAQRRVALAQRPERAQHVGVALALDEVGDGHERRDGGRAPTARAGSSVPRWTTRVRSAPSSRAERAMPALLASTRRAAPNARAVAARPRVVTDRRVEDVGAVLGDDQRRPLAAAQQGVGRGHGVVGVDELVRELAAQPRAARGAAPVPPTHPTTRSCASAAARRSARSDVGGRRVRASADDARARSAAPGIARPASPPAGRCGAGRRRVRRRRRRARRAPGGAPRCRARGRGRAGRTR